MHKKYLTKTLGWVLTLIFTLALVSPFLVGAAETGLPASETGNPPAGSPVIKIKIDNPFKAGSIPELIDVLLNEILIPIGAVIAVLMVMYAGFLFVTARGDTAQIKKAKDALLWAVIGAAILLGAKVITDAIQGTIKELKS
jgi:hypothetical protein